MSEHSRSPPRIKVDTDVHLGLSAAHPARYMVSPGKEAEAQGLSQHSMLLAQLTEGLQRSAGENPSTSMMFSVGGVPTMIPHQSAFSMGRTGLRAPLPSQAILSQPTGVPILRGSGLVSLAPDMVPPGHRTSPQPSRLQLHDVGMSLPVQGPMGRLRVPSPSLSAASGLLIRTPSPKPAQVIEERPSPKSSVVRTVNPSSYGKRPHIVTQQQANMAMNMSRTSPNPMHRVSPNPVSRVSPGSVTIHRASPSAQVQHRASPVSRASPAPHRVSPVPSHRVSPAPAHRVSPAPPPRMSPAPPHRVSPGPPRSVSPSPPQRVSPGPPQRMTPVVAIPRISIGSTHSVVVPGSIRKTAHNPTVHTVGPVNLHRTSPVPVHKMSANQPVKVTLQQRASPGLHRASPGRPAMEHRASPVMTNSQHKPDHRELPGRMVQAEQTRHFGPSPMGLPAAERPHASSTHRATAVAAHRVSPGPPPRVSAAQPAPVAHTSSTVIPTHKTFSHPGSHKTSDTGRRDKIDIVNNPFAAAMSAMKQQITAPDSSSHPEALLNILIKNQPKPQAPQKIKQEKEDQPPPVLKKQEPVHGQLRPFSTETTRAGVVKSNVAQAPVGGTVHAEPHPLPMLHKHLTTPLSVSTGVGGNSSSFGPRNSSLNPPPLLPLLSSIPGMCPRTASDVTAIAHPDVHRQGDTRASADGMPRLIPETPLLQNHVNGDSLLPPDHIKEEEEEDAGEDEDKKLFFENPFSQRVKNLENFPLNPSSFKTTYRSQGMAIHRAKAGCIMNTARSLDILRHNLQKFINKEIDEVVQRYVEEYFKPGVENIRVNCGDHSVSDDHMAAVCRQILEEAKKMYMASSRCNTPDPSAAGDNASESSHLVPPENKTVREKKLDLFKIKRRRGSSDSEASVTKKKRKGRPPLKAGNGRATPSKTGKNDPVKREGPKWDPERLKTDMQFVMGARANKALGLGAQRGRLYIKHPDIFKYAGDQEDKNWLHENHHMPATGGKAYLLLVEDIMDLAQNNEYKGSPGLMLGEVIGFCVPDWMREKMKEQMKAHRTDAPKPGKPKLPPPLMLAPGVTEGPGMTLPFSDQKPPNVADVKSDMQPSPSTTENMDVMSTEQDDDDPPSISPLNMTGGFADISATPEVSPAPSMEVEDIDDDDDDDEPPLTAPFSMT